MTHPHDDQPLAFRRVFPLAQLAEPAEGLPGENGRGLITAAARSGGPADAAHDIVDPYGRGSEAAAVSADRLDRLVNTGVRRLREVDVRQ
jgi:sulfate adenylyltransferase